MPNELENPADVDDVVLDQDDAVAPAQAEVDAAPAASSTAPDDQPEGDDSLSIVRDVLDKRAAPKAEASSAEGKEAGAEDDADKPTKDEQDGYEDVPFNKHPRFKQLLQERNDLRLDATRYRNVQGFLEREGLSGEDAAHGLTLIAHSRKAGLTGEQIHEGLQTMALALHDPGAAFEQMRPWLEKLLTASGKVLPPDLKERVQRGELTAEAASEISVSRAQLQNHEAQRTFAEQRAQSERQTEFARSMNGAAASWEDERRQKDPNFDAKLPAITAEVKRLHALGMRPNSPEGVKEQLQTVYRTVNGRLGAEVANANRAAVPAPRPAPRPAVRPVMGGQVSGSAGSEPQSTLDHVNAVLAKRRAG